jgi:hypothetical protein
MNRTTSRYFQQSISFGFGEISLQMDLAANLFAHAAPGCTVITILHVDPLMAKLDLDIL